MTCKKVTCKKYRDDVREGRDETNDILKEWRIDRHYMGKAKTFDAAYHAHDTSKAKS